MSDVMVMSGLASSRKDVWLTKILHTTPHNHYRTSRTKQPTPTTMSCLERGPNEVLSSSHLTVMCCQCKHLFITSNTPNFGSKLKNCPKCQHSHIRCKRAPDSTVAKQNSIYPERDCLYAQYTTELLWSCWACGNMTNQFWDLDDIDSDDATGGDRLNGYCEGDDCGYNFRMGGNLIWRDWYWARKRHVREFFALLKEAGWTREDGLRWLESQTVGRYEAHGVYLTGMKSRTLHWPFHVLNVVGDDKDDDNDEEEVSYMVWQNVDAELEEERMNRRKRREMGCPEHGDIDSDKENGK
ncbi:hypothetical protein EX30DRAFT_111944 [Ascodesmis nigricans]|uniref:Uncharacterized protein n=1 Tax=Ascodesmis nigricans TaxID=341454 RepID=A0A4S2MQ66_9PEZI|nr:hypothetical protein EX30DRAFT_111944 [Ascodesmis nigricans]